MPGHDMIVVGASAGGVETLCQLVGDLPSNLPAAIFVVLHIPAQSPSVLPKILNRSIQKRNGQSSLLACHPQDGEAIQHGRIYVAPPDRHLLVKDGYIRLVRGPKENSNRPAVDPLFRTAVRTYGPRVVGVVLSGTLDDGTAGLMAVKNRGGVAIVQNPDEALYSGMPKSAIENVDVDHILGISEIAPVLVELAHKPVETEQVEAVSSEMQMESDIAEMEPSAVSSTNRPGTPSPFGCPECGGALWELDQEGLIRFRCRTGHAFSANTLLAEQSEALEEALWSAFRALEEKAALAQRIATQARDRNRIISAERFEEQEQDARQRAALVRQLLLKDNGNGQMVGEQGSKGAAEQRSNGATEKAISSSPLQMVAISTSGGGMKALTELLSALPADFPAAITIVQQLHPQYPSGLKDILEANTTLKVKQAEDGDLLRPGTVYVAPNDRHLLVNPDSTLSLSHSELVHFARPSTDLLFESVAASLKQQAIAVVLTGNGSDGAMGVRAIKEMGGAAIAQDQASCEDFEMPSRAISTGSVDWVLPLNEIAAMLVNLVTKKNEETQES